MQKKTKKVKQGGRIEEISAEKLLERFRALKRVLEDNWGRIGLKLQRIRNSDDVREIFKVLPGVQWFPPFRDHSAKCFIEEGSREIGVRELRETQKRQREAVANLSRCYSEYHPAQQNATAAKTALKALIQEYGSAPCLIHFLRRVFAVAKELEVKSLVEAAALTEVHLREAQEHQQKLTERRSSEEAWFARNEVVAFVQSRRHIASPANFAKAMAGLPEYSWIHSFRKCPEDEEDHLYPTTLNYQLFELLQTVVKKVSRLTAKEIEMTLRKELLKRDSKDLVRVHFGPSWWYIQEGIASCAGLRCKRNEAAYVLMGKIQDQLEQGRTITEIELAKRRQLI